MEKMELLYFSFLGVFVQEHGHEFNADHALQELYDYVRRYQDQVGMTEYTTKPYGLGVAFIAHQFQKA